MITVKQLTSLIEPNWFVINGDEVQAFHSESAAQRYATGLWARTAIRLSDGMDCIR